MLPDDQKTSDARPMGSPRAGAPGVWQPPPVEELQAMLPQYEVLEIVGRGGMGAVYQARQKSLRRLVAIKVLPPEVSDDELKFRERFQHEAETMAALSHPGIVAVHDFGETESGLLYFVMEFIDGTDVARRIASEGALPVDEAVLIARAVCDALDYAHSRGVIHRDIKPANVLIDGESRIKVADFGLAKITGHSQESGITRTNVALGTQEFAAPEQLTSGAVVDHRADIYSLGVMLYQMLTGDVPRVMFKLPSRCRPGLGTRFDALICKALETDPAERFQSTTEFRRELDAVATVSAAPTNPSAAVKQGTHLGRPKLISAAAVAMVAFGVGGWFFFGHRQEQASLSALEKTTTNTPALSSSTLPHNEWIKLLNTPEAVARSGIKGLELKDGWLTVTPERLYLFRLAGGNGKVHDMAFRAMVRPPTNEWPVAVVLHAGANPEYFLDVHHDCLTLRRVRHLASSKRDYSDLGNVPLDLRQAKGGAFQLEVTMQENLITVMADGAKVMEVRDDGGTAGAEDIALVAPSETKGRGKIKDLALKVLDAAPAASIPRKHDRTIDLLALIDVKHDAIKGDWSRTNDGIAVERSELGVSSFLQLPYKPPMAYDFEIEFTPKDGTGFVGQVFPAEGRPVTWLVDLPLSSGRKAGFFASAEGKQLKDNLDASIVRPRFLTNGRHHVARIEVRGGKVTGWLDGGKLVEWKGEIARPALVSHDFRGEGRDPECLALRAPQRAVVFHKITVREIGGSGMADTPAN